MIENDVHKYSKNLVNCILIKFLLPLARRLWVLGILSLFNIKREKTSITQFHNFKTIMYAKQRTKN